MTNATDELRRMLDERGVEWKAIDGDGMCFTEWRTHGGAFVYTARESLRSYGDNDLHVETCGIPSSCLIATPEQAIAATLGEANEDECYLMRHGEKFPVELDYGFLGVMPIVISVAGFRYLLEVPDEK